MNVFRHTAALGAAALMALVPVGTASATSMQWGTSTIDQTLGSIEDLERDHGRSFDAVRVFVRWDAEFPDAYHRELQAAGKKVLLSVQTLRGNGQPVLWSEVASARTDTQVGRERAAWVQKVEAYAPHTFTFAHEPEAAAKVPMGTAAEYIAAWRRVRQDFRASAGVDPTFLLIHTAHAYALPATDRRQAVKWYPGDWYVDAIGADAYNWHTCPPGGGGTQAWRTLRHIIEPFRQFGARHPGEELWLPEYGTVEHVSDPLAKARWYQDAAVMFAEPAYDQFRGVLSFNPNLSGCQWNPRSSEQSLAAYAEFGQAV